MTRPTPVPAPTAAASRDDARQALRSRWLLGASIVLVAANLRPLFGSLSVLLPEVMATTGLGATGASLLTTLPVLCLGLFAFPAPALARRFGTERVVAAALLLIVLGTALRGAAGAGPAALGLLYAASALGGAGIALVNVLLPGLVKRDFGPRAPLVTACYTLAVCLGAAAAAGLTVPLEAALGLRWPGALALWAAPALATLLLWLPHAHAAGRPAGAGAGAPPVRLWRDPLAWQVTGFMGLQSSLAYVVMGWLAPLLRERGLGAAEAGWVAACAIGAQLATCFAAPIVAARLRRQGALAAGCATLTTCALLALQFAPLAGGWQWAWAVLLGCGQGASFSLALTLIVARSPDTATAARLSGMAQGVGYLISVIGPLATGLLRSATGSFDAAGALFVVLGIATALCGAGAGRALLVGAPRGRPGAAAA